LHFGTKAKKGIVMAELTDLLRQTIAESLGASPGELSMDTKAEDIDTWDSMGTMTILLSLETVFGLRLAPGQTGRLQSVRGIVELLEESGKLR
jgi:acyl carrier protein